MNALQVNKYQRKKTLEKQTKKQVYALKSLDFPNKTMYKNKLRLYFHQIN